MRFYYLSVLLFSLFICFGEADLSIYENGQLNAAFADYSWADKTTTIAADSTVLYKGSPSYSFIPQYYSAIYFSCKQKGCITTAKTDSVVVYVNWGTNLNTIISVSLVNSTSTGSTVNFPPLLTAPQLSQFASVPITKNAWVRCVVPMSAFGASGPFDGIEIIGNVNLIQNTIWIGSVVTGPYASSAGFLSINGAKSFALGSSIPNVPGNFGRDFGTNAWGANGVGTAVTFGNATTVFRTVNKNAGNAVRWNLFTDLRAGIVFDANNYPTALNAEVFTDINYAITLAKSFKVGISFTIFDVTAFQQAVTSDKGVVLGGHSDLITDPSKTAAFINIVMNPILKKYASSTAIFSWEIVNNVEKIISDLPAGSPGSVSTYNLVTMSQFWTFMNTMSKTIKAATGATSANQLVTMGSLSLKWINLYTPSYATANNLPSLLLDYYSVGYDTWMDGVSYNNDTDLGTVNGSPFNQAVGDLISLEGRPVVVNNIVTPAVNLSMMYQTLFKNGYSGVFENYATTAWTNYKAWGVLHANDTLWAGVLNPTLPVFNTNKTVNATAAPTTLPTGIPSGITFIPTVIYGDELADGWMDYSWAILRNDDYTSYKYSGANSYVFDPTNYDALYFYKQDSINTATDYAITFYISGGTNSGQIIQFALVDANGKKSSAGAIPLSALGVTVPANKWQKVVIVLKNFPLGTYSGLQIMGGLSTTQSPVYIDEVTLLSYPVASTNSSTTNNNAVSAIQSPASTVTASTFFTFAFVLVAVLLNILV